MMKISFSPPDMSAEEVAEVKDAILSGWITTGPKTKEFERQIAEFCGVNRAVCLNSQTAGAEMALRVLGIGAGDGLCSTGRCYYRENKSDYSSGFRRCTMRL